MDVGALLHRTGDPAFASDEKARIISWNPAVEKLLGYQADSVLGKPCHAVLGGRDLFGNLHCREDCNLRQMIRRREPICNFALQVRDATGHLLPVACSIVVVCEEQTEREFTILHLLETAGIGAQRDAEDDPAEPARLTRREIEILQLLAQGHSTREVAHRLSLTVSTVRTHIQNVLRKLEAHNKLQAIFLARRQHLI
jgi:PAS domain S-box-containing protein